MNDIPHQLNQCFKFNSLVGRSFYTNALNTESKEGGSICGRQQPGGSMAGLLFTTGSTDDSTKTDLTAGLKYKLNLQDDERSGSEAQVWVMKGRKHNKRRQE